MNIFGENPNLKRSEIVYYKNGRFGPRLQGNLQLVYIFEGDALISIDGTTEYLGPGEATLLLPGREERFIFARDMKTWHGWSEVVQPDLPADVIKRLDELPFRNPISERMRQIDKMLSTVDPSEEGLFSSLIQALFFEFLSIAGFRRDTSTTLPFHPSVEKARELIRTHSAEPLKLTDIARQSGVTSAHLIRIFKAALETTPMDYLWTCRVEAASHLLAETGLSSAEVAYRCGFANPAHFSRRFKQVMQITPGKYRRKAWGIKDL